MVAVSKHAITHNMTHAVLLADTAEDMVASVVADVALVATEATGYGLS